MQGESTIRVALVGAGKWMESHHLPVLSRLREQWPLEFIGIWNRTQEKAVRLAGLFGIPKVYPRLEDLVEDPTPNCRVVVVDKEVLFTILQVLNKNPLPFLCEKPPGQTSAQAKALASQIRVPHVLAFNRRYAPLHNHLRSFLHEQERLPYWAECSFYRRARKDPHMVVESGIHGINFLEFLLGPIRKATPLPFRKKYILRTGGSFKERVEPRMAMVEFASGTKGLLKFFPCTGKALEWYEFQGEDYSTYLRMQQPFLDEEKETLSIFRQRGEEASASVVELEPPSQDPFLQQGFVGEYEEFLQIVQDLRKPSRSTFQNGWSSLAVAEAIEQGRVYRGFLLSPMPSL